VAGGPDDGAVVAPGRFRPATPRPPHGSVTADDMSFRIALQHADGVIRCVVRTPSVTDVPFDRCDEHHPQG